MRDHDIDAEVTATQQRRVRRDEDGGGAGERTSMQVSRAIEAGRPGALDPQAMLHLQRAAGNAGTAALVGKADEESPVQDVVSSSGRQLDSSTQRDMEARFGTDFSDVEVHTDGRAASSARSVSAQAYTVGNHVVFGDGNYRPDTDDGRHMIAHELTHVVQQRSGPVDGTSVGGGVKVSDPGDRFERQADDTARAVMQRTEAPEEDEEELQSMAIQRAAEEEELVEESPASEMPASELPVEEQEEEG